MNGTHPLALFIYDKICVAHCLATLVVFTIYTHSFMTIVNTSRREISLPINFNVNKESRRDIGANIFLP